MNSRSKVDPGTVTRAFLVESAILEVIDVFDTMEEHTLNKIIAAAEACIYEKAFQEKNKTK